MHEGVGDERDVSEDEDDNGGDTVDFRRVEYVTLDLGGMKGVQQLIAGDELVVYNADALYDTELYQQCGNKASDICVIRSGAEVMRAQMTDMVGTECYFNSAGEGILRALSILSRLRNANFSRSTQGYAPSRDTSRAATSWPWEIYR